MYADNVGHTNCIFPYNRGYFYSCADVFFSITNSSFPQVPMKSSYSHDIYSISVTVVDAKGWVEVGRGSLTTLVGHKQ